MIRISRGHEPKSLAPVRVQQLAILRALGHEPTSKEIDGYKIIGDELWAAQYNKCCYCEQRIAKDYNDVEHYRPKAEADRKPGCVLTHGYWWLAFTWENLLFSCPSCNRSHKKIRFPLASGGITLVSENAPPGGEQPLLIDPASNTNPVEHIEFVYSALDPTQITRQWWARPRNLSVFGSMTIEVCGLNRSDLRELRQRHYRTVVIPHTNAIKNAITSKNYVQAKSEYDRAIDLLSPENIYVGLTYDALRFDIPDSDLKTALGLEWPKPNEVA